MIKQLFIALFFIAFIADLFFITQGIELRYVSRPLIMIALTAYLLSSLGKKLNDHPYMLVACIFAILGDVVSLGNDMNALLFGVIAFLLMYVAYSLSFFKQKAIGAFKHQWKIFLTGSLAFFSIMILWNRMGDIRFLMILYILSICACLLMALMRWKSKGYQMVLIGACLFFVSNILGASLEFFFRFEYFELLSMFTYGLGQYCVIEGFIRGVKL